MATVYRAIWPNQTGQISVTWRAMTRREIRECMARYGHLELTPFSPMALYLEVYEKVLVEGPPVETVSAGIVSFIARQQLENNAFTGNYRAILGKLQQKRQWLAENWIESARAIIAASFHIPFAEIDEWDEDLFFERFVQAEYLSGHPFDPVNPDAPPPSAARPQEVPQRPMTAREAAYMRAKQRRARADAEEAKMQDQSGPSTEEFSWQR